MNAEISSTTLLKRYAQERDEGAFHEVVARYFNLVHATAIRRLNGNETNALDVAQVVFTDLARKAHQLREETQLGGWLHQHTCFTASKWVRSEIRRNVREQEAAEMSSLNQSPNWSAVEPVVDEALQTLSEPDRAAILLRYFEGRDLRGVGQALKVSEDTAQKRVQRAVEKLRSVLEAKGVTVSVPALGVLLLANASPSHATAPIGRIVKQAIADHGKIVSVFSLPKVAAVAALLVLLIGFGSKFFTATQVKEDNAQSAAALEPGVQDAATVSANADNPGGQAEAQPQVPSNPAPAVGVEGRRYLTLHIVNGVTKQPLELASVRVTASNRPDPFRPNAEDIYVSSDARGVALIPLPTNDLPRLQLETSREGFGDWLSIWDKAKGEIVPEEFTVALPPGIAMGGHVLDPDGNPVAEAQVALGRFWSGDDPIDRSSQRLELRTVRTRTDANGAWSVTTIPEALISAISFDVTHPEYAKFSKSLRHADLPELTTRNWNIQLARGFTVSGRVTDTNNVAIEGAKVFYGARFSGKRKQTSTDGEGRYKLVNLVEDPYGFDSMISVLADGYAIAAKAFTNLPTAEINFALQPGRVIRGIVQNKEGQPIRSATVSRESRSSNMRDDGFEWSVKTDAEGHFQWTSAPSELQFFYVGHGDYEPLRNFRIDPSETNQIIVMKKKGVAQGTVVSAESGQPVERFFVLPASGDTNEISGWSSTSEREFKNGVFNMALDDTGQTVVQIRARGFRTAIFEIPAAGQSIRAQLNPGKSLTGQIIDSTGDPVRGAEIAAINDHRHGYTTIAKGRFARGGVKADRAVSDDAGTFTLFLTGEAKSIAVVHPESGFAHVSIPEFERSAEIRLLRWGRLEGTVLDGDKMLANEKIVISCGVEGLHLDHDSFLATTDGQGRFIIDMAPPGRLDAYRLVPTSKTVSTHRDQTNITINPGAVTYVEIHVSKGK